jgi:hypothetical protein
VRCALCRGQGPRRRAFRRSPFARVVQVYCVLKKNVKKKRRATKSQINTNNMSLRSVIIEVGSFAMSRSGSGSGGSGGVASGGGNDVARRRARTLAHTVRRPPRARPPQSAVSPQPVHFSTQHALSQPQHSVHHPRGTRPWPLLPPSSLVTQVAASLLALGSKRRVQCLRTSLFTRSWPPGPSSSARACGC